jgi:hypothetical protein
MIVLAGRLPCLLVVIFVGLTVLLICYTDISLLPSYHVISIYFASYWFASQLVVLGCYILRLFLVVTFALLYIKIKGSYPTYIFSDLGLLFASRFLEMCQHVLTHINFFSVVVVQALAQRRCSDGLWHISPRRLISMSSRRNTVQVSFTWQVHEQENMVWGDFTVSLKFLIGISMKD